MKTIVILFLVLTSVIRLNACSCLGQTSLKQEIKHVDLIVAAQVIDSQIVRVWADTSLARSFFESNVKNGQISPDESYLHWKTTQTNMLFYHELIDYRVVIQERFKGAKRNDTILIRTGFGHGDCGFRFRVGERYLIYAVRENKVQYSDDIPDRSKRELAGIYRTNICRRTSMLAAATEDLVELRN